MKMCNVNGNKNESKTVTNERLSKVNQSEIKRNPKIEKADRLRIMANNKMAKLTKLVDEWGEKSSLVKTRAEEIEIDKIYEPKVNKESEKEEESYGVYYWFVTKNFDKKIIKAALKLAKKSKKDKDGFNGFMSKTFIDELEKMTDDETLGESAFNLIAGYSAEKRALKNICDVLNNRESYISKGAKMPKGLILYGSAGTGKTLFARVLAQECKLQMNVVDFAKCLDEKSVLKQIQKAFNRANKSKAMQIVFIDELDKILPNVNKDYVSDTSKITLTKLLTLIDGINKKSKVFFVATCNDYYSLPSTITRPGRIDKKIMLSEPNLKSRKEIIEKYVAKTGCYFDLPVEEMAVVSRGLSCAAIETFVNECVLETRDGENVSAETIYRKIREIKNENIEHAKSPAELSLSAWHNLGHLVVARTLSDSDYILDLEEGNLCSERYKKLIDACDDGDYDDYDEDDDYDEGDDYDEDDEDYYEENCENEKNDMEEDDVDESKEQECTHTVVENPFYNKTDYVNAITVLYAGFVAEEMILGNVFDNCYRDLYQAHSVLVNMSQFGLLGIDRVFFPETEKEILYSYDYKSEIAEYLKNVSQLCYKKAQQIVWDNLSLMRYLYNYLMEEKTMTKYRAEELIKNFKMKS